MQRLLAILLVMMLAFTVACGDDDDGDDDDGGDTAAPTATTATGGGETTPTEGSDDGDDTTPTEGSDDGGDTGGGDAAAGEQLAQSQGCTACHSTDGSVIVGPSWQGLYGSEVELENGETVTADEAYITESIREPGAKIHAGFSNLMPPADLSDEQIADLIAYIQTLE